MKEFFAIEKVPLLYGQGVMETREDVAPPCLGDQLGITANIISVFEFSSRSESHTSKALLRNATYLIRKRIDAIIVLKVALKYLRSSQAQRTRSIPYQLKVVICLKI